MTRFWITINQGIDLVDHAFKDIEVVKFIPKIPSIKIVDLAKAMSPKTRLKIIGIRLLKNYTKYFHLKMSHLLLLVLRNIILLHLII